MDCKITENYFKEKARMTKTNENGSCTIGCGDCPFFSENNKKGIPCACFQHLHPAEAIAIVQKWSDEHPQKTYKDDFFEKFPNAFKNMLGVPMYCRKNLYEGSGSNECRCGDCTDCWNEVMPE